jgi:plasmid stabilization system protein ParE
MAVIFNRSVQKDVWQILDFYQEKSGKALADAFYRELMECVLDAGENPTRYHFIYRQIGKDIRVLVVRHHKRHPSFGLKRR